MKKRFSILFLSVSFVLCAIGTLSSCKDYEEDSYADLVASDAKLQEAFDAQISNLKDQITALEKAKQQLNDTLQNYVKRAELTDSLKNYATKEALKDSCKVYQIRYNSLAELISNIQTTLDDNVTRTKALEEKLAAMDESNSQHEATQQQLNDSIRKALADIDKQNIKTGAHLSALDGSVGVLKDSVNLVDKKVTDLYTQVGTLGKTLENLGTQLTVLGNNIASVDAKADDALVKAELSLKMLKATQDTLKNFATKVELQAALDSAIAMKKTAMAYTDMEVAKVQTQLDANTTKLGEIQSAFQTADDQLQGQITALSGRLDKLSTQVDIYYNELTNKFNALKKAVTSVIAQGTYNPVFGSFALPVDTRSQILAAYYGKSTFGDYSFPTARPGIFAKGYGSDENTTLTEKDLEMVASTNVKILEGTLVANDGAIGNAGTMYVTINPSNADYTGVTLPLVNSQDVESTVKLGALKRSDAVLNFGYTRAAINAFYEAPATLTAAGISAAKPRVDLANLKSTIKEAIQDKANVNLKNLAQSLYTNMSDVLDANAIKVSSSVGTEARNIYSSYSIAATAIKPLSYNFMYNSNYSIVPKISPLSINGIKFDGTITVNTGTIATPKIYVVVEVPSTVDKDGNVTAYKKDTIYVEGIDALVKNIQDQVGAAVSDNIDQLIDSINGQINSTLDSYVSKLNSYVTKINSFSDKINNLINSVNRRLQPTLLYSTVAGTYEQLSNTKYIPTQVSKGSSYALFATSYSAELLAPAYKKWVAVTNVYAADYLSSAQSGNLAAKKVLTLTNTNSTNSAKSISFGKATDGSSRAFKFTPYSAGYVYEITYVTVDYSGQQTVNKYYVKVI